MTLQDAFSLTDKVAIVTGAGRGIGAQTAKTYAEAGADLVLAARTKEQLDAVAEEVRGFGRRALVIPCDANENEALEDVVAQTMAEFGRIDVVVNNAGGTMPRPFMDTSAGYLERAFHFNVTTAFVLTKAAAPHMLASGSGAVVNISSAIGRLRDRGFVAYGTAKAALTHMTRLMAADLAPKVRVERDRGGIGCDECARDRARQSGDPRRDGAPHAGEAPRAPRGHRVLPRCTSRHPRAAS